MAFDRSPRTSFDDVAQLYEEIRPGYPAQLFEDIVSLSGIPQEGRILEVGCGPGKATIPFAKRGYTMLCLELGENLAALAAEKMRAYPAVEIQNIAFEDWPVERASFDLFISAQAFHWIPPDVGYARAAATLKGSGTLALFWTQHPVWDTPVRLALDRVYRDKAPQIADADQKNSAEVLTKRTVDDIDASGLFRGVLVKHYPWSERYTAEQYTKLLSTYSDHRCLPDDTRWDLFVAIHELIEGSGGMVEIPYVTVLYLAQVKR
jgi:SAM-dependent methyltransferase